MEEIVVNSVNEDGKYTVALDVNPSGEKDIYCVYFSRNDAEELEPIGFFDTKDEAMAYVNDSIAAYQVTEESANRMRSVLVSLGYEEALRLRQELVANGINPFNDSTWLGSQGVMCFGPLLSAVWEGRTECIQRYANEGGDEPMCDFACRVGVVPRFIKSAKYALANRKKEVSNV